MTDRKAVAAAVFAEIRDSLIGAEKNIQRVLDDKLWFDLGYSSFYEAWISELAGVRLASDIVRGAVLEQMVREGVSNADIAANVPGAGPVKIKKAREKADPTYVPKAVKPSGAARPYVIHAPVTPQEYAAWKKICDDDGTSLTDEAVMALRDWFGAV